MKDIRAGIGTALPLSILAGSIGLAWGLLAWHNDVSAPPIAAAVPAVGCATSAIVAAGSQSMRVPVMPSLVRTTAQLLLVFGSVIFAAAVVGHRSAPIAAGLALLLAGTTWAVTRPAAQVLASRWPSIAESQTPTTAGSLRVYFLAGLVMIVFPTLAVQLPAAIGLGPGSLCETVYTCPTDLTIKLHLPRHIASVELLVALVVMYVLTGLVLAAALRYCTVRRAPRSRSLRLPRSAPSWASASIALLALALASVMLLPPATSAGAGLARPVGAAVSTSAHDAYVTTISLLSEFGVAIPGAKCPKGKMSYLCKPRGSSSGGGGGGAGRKRRIHRRPASDIVQLVMGGAAALFVVAYVVYGLLRRRKGRGTRALVSERGGQSRSTGDRLRRIRRAAIFSRDPRDRILRLYRNFVRQAKRRGSPRAASQTAREHSVFVASHVGGVAADIQTLIRVYHQARFSQRQVDSNDVAGMEQATRQIGRVLRAHARRGTGT